MIQQRLTKPEHPPVLMLELAEQHGMGRYALTRAAVRDPRSTDLLPQG